MYNYGSGGFDFQAAIGTAGTIVALLGVIASLSIARRGQKQDLQLAKADAERAELAEKAGAASADRAENAAALTIDTMSRMADALDKMATQGIGGSTLLAQAPPERVSWSLTHHQGDMYMLTNTGEATAYDVQVSAHESLLQVGEWVSEAQLRHGEAMTFIAARTMATSDSTITVEWATEPDGERDIWRYPLPPRPPR